MTPEGAASRIRRMQSCGLWLMGLALLFHAAASGQAVPAAAPPVPVAPRTVVLMQIDGSVGPAVADHVHRGLLLAAREKAELAVIQLDTTSGFEASARSIVEDIRGSGVPVATLVGPDGARVGGPGLAIVEASQIAAMVPGSTLDMTPPLSAREALEKKVVTLIARDVGDLLLQVNGRELTSPMGTARLTTQRAQVIVFATDWRIRLLSVITEPTVTLLLLMVGICGLLLEFSRPGVWLPGAVGGACAILALFGLHLLLFSGVAMALVVFGAVLLVVEGVRPSFGLAGLVGAALFIVGAERLIDLSAPGFGPPLWVVACMGGVAAVAIFVIARSAARERRRLKEVGVSALVGSTGELMEYANGTGWAQIQGDYWPVTGTGDLYAGRRVRVNGMQGSALTVAPDSQEALPNRP